MSLGIYVELDIFGFIAVVRLTRVARPSDFKSTGRAVSRFNGCDKVSGEKIILSGIWYLSAHVFCFHGRGTIKAEKTSICVLKCATRQKTESGQKAVYPVSALSPDFMSGRPETRKIAGKSREEMMQDTPLNEKIPTFYNRNLNPNPGRKFS